MIWKLGSELSSGRTVCVGAREMAQRLRALTVLPEVLEFNSQQPHGGSQPSMRPGALLWQAGTHADRTL